VWSGEGASGVRAVDAMLLLSRQRVWPVECPPAKKVRSHLTSWNLWIEFLWEQWWLTSLRILGDITEVALNPEVNVFAKDREETDTDEDRSRDWRDGATSQAASWGHQTGQGTVGSLFPQHGGETSPLSVTSVSHFWSSFVLKVLGHELRDPMGLRGVW
jgi:hypothetical protein